MSSSLKNNTTNLQSILTKINELPNAGSAAVQSDWEQTDEAAPDFIKNKPFYETRSVIAEEQTCPFDEDFGGYLGEILTPIIAGDTLVVTYNGESYLSETIYFEPMEAILFGDLGALGIGSQTDSPFVGISDNTIFAAMPVDTENIESLIGTTAVIKIEKPHITKIPQRYYETQTVFYMMDDVYLYVDAGCTIKATKQDVINAVSLGGVSVHTVESGVTYQAFTSIAIVTAHAYAQVQIVNKVLHTAEYTPEGGN